jgi:hypothetical protein
MELFPTPMALELEVQNIAKKLVKYVVQPWWQIFLT